VPCFLVSHVAMEKNNTLFKIPDSILLTCIHAVSIDFSRRLLQERETELFSLVWWTGDGVFAGRGVTL
jgi:hypothetical protein